MDIQQYIDAAIKARREQRMKDTDQLTLGQFIERIEQCGVYDEEGKPKSVVYDFGNMYPTKLDSWRGAYEELALGYSENWSNNMTNAVQLLEDCKGAVGKVYEGYKGGEFTMDKNTPIWVANYGHSSDTAVVGVITNSYKLIILTAYNEY